MTIWNQIQSWLRTILQRQRSETEMDSELHFHLDACAEDLVRAGVPLQEAQRRARLEFGGLEQTKEHCRDATGANFFNSLLQDLRFAFRQSRKNRGFALTALMVLALGMGVSIAIFGFVDAALLQPLPYANPDRVMSVNESDTELPGWPLSYPDFLDWQALNKSFSSFAVYTGSGYLLRSSSGAEPVSGERVSGSFFQTLGVQPILGRDFNPKENDLGGPNVVLLSYGAWVRRFGARTEAIGQTVDLDDQAYTIIGVLPPSFSFALSGNAEFWVPINRLSPHEHSRTFFSFFGIARLRDGISPQSAQIEMRAISKQLRRQYGIVNHDDLNASVVPFADVVVGDVRPILLTLLGGAGLLLLIACVNVGSLVLVRSENRRREIAVRGALGATPSRLLTQFVTEGLLLTAFASAASIAIAAALIKLLAGVVPRDMASSMPFLQRVGWNAHTLAFAACIATLAALLMTATPALRLLSQAVRDGLSDGGRGVASQFWRRFGANMVIIELAFAVVLLAGAGLLGRSFYHLLHVPLGFDPNYLATARISLPDSVYNTTERTEALYREVVRRSASLPDVESAGLTANLPVQCNCPTDRIRIVGRPYHGEPNEVNERHVSASYLPTLKATLRRGRFFTEVDDVSRTGVAVINQTLARKFFPDQDPIGQRIANDEGGHASVWEIVGVIDDIREGPLDVDIAPTEYFPINQTGDHSFVMVVRTRQDAAAVLPLLGNTVHQIDLTLGVSDEATMTDRIARTQTALLHQYSAWLVSSFAAMALILGVVGLYGVIAYSVSQRTREIGVRMALGADPKSVVFMVLREAGKMVGLGVFIGLFASFALARMMGSILFGVSFCDPLTFAGVAMVLSTVALAACYIPARRASIVDPMAALRYE
jgi:macrolide transport system ATP-binding/permease protein